MKRFYALRPRSSKKAQEVLFKITDKDGKKKFFPIFFVLRSYSENYLSKLELNFAERASFVTGLLKKNEIIPRNEILQIATQLRTS